MHRMCGLKCAAMSEARYVWEPAVLDAFRADAETVAAKIVVAKEAIAERLKDNNPPDATETSALMYALESLETLGALGRIIDPEEEGPGS
jgi:hypothetical protein